MFHFSFFIFNEKTPFPGYAALLPVTGTLLLIYVQHDYSNDWLGKLIISRPIVYLGVISYSLYLWHWPIFSFVNYELYAAPSVERSLLKISASLLLAIISYHILEKPARIFLNKPSRKYFGFLVFLSVTSAIIWVSFYIHTENHVSAESWQVASGGIAINKQIDKTCIMLMGDSNASMYGNSIKSLAEKLNIKAQIISVDAGNPLPNSKLWNDSINAIKTAKPDYVIFAASWSGKINSIGKQEKLLLALNEINKYSKFIVLITQPQILPEQGTRDYIQKHGITKVVEEKEEYAFRNSANSYIKLLANDRISVLDIEDAFYGHDQEIKFLDSNGNYLYQDSRHLSGLGAAVVINNYLAPMLIGHSNQYLTCASNGHAKSTRR